MRDMIIQLISGAIGSLGFAIIFHVQKKYAVHVLSGSIICWFVYLAATAWFGGNEIFLPTLISGFVTAIYAEILARVCKAPSTVFFMTSIIPLIPGRLLFYFMQAIVQEQYSKVSEYGSSTFLTALGIALGMSAAWTICDFSRKIGLKKLR